MALNTAHVSTVIRSAALGAALVLGTSSHATLVDRGGGLVYDTVLDVTWLQDANYAATSGYQVSGRAADDGMVNGRMDWQEAMSWADSLSYYDAVRGVTWTDWRLPSLASVTGGAQLVLGVATLGESDDGYNISAPGTLFAGSTASELAYTYYNTLGNVARCPVVGGWDACVDSTLPRATPFNAGPFVNLGGIVWTGSRQDLPFSPDAWAFDFTGAAYGGQGGYNGSGFYGRQFAWALRDGDVGLTLAAGVVPEAQTLSMMLLGLGIVGLRVGRRRQ